MKSIIIFASGNGSNAKEIYNYSIAQKTFHVAAIFCNNQNAGIIDFCMDNDIECLLFSNKELLEETFLQEIVSFEPSLIVLAGFLKKIPEYLINAFPNKIINIHPALLPKYGGAGMYGHHIHEAIVANNETETGITIHYVNAQYDEGKIILQAKTNIDPSDTPEIVAQKVLQLEHEHYKKVVESLLV
jgi:phosphoribosylglycinamide formyltransferase 1